MSKRRNENGQMRREEYEAQEEEEQDEQTSHGIQLASDDVIKQRKIVQARPRARPQPPNPPSTTNISGSNPFQGFQGLTTTQPTNPFAGFSGLTGATATPPKPSFGTNLPSSSASAKPSTYQEAISVLNKEFLEFANEQLKKNPNSNWSAAVQDYLLHADCIGTQFASTKPVAVTGRTQVSTANSQKNTVIAPKVVSPTKVKESDDTSLPVKPGFSFGKVHSPEKSTSASMFGAVPQTVPVTAGSGLFKSNEAPASSTSVSFGASKAIPDSEKAKSEFSFGAMKALNSEKETPASSFGATKASNAEKVTPSFSFGATKASPDSELVTPAFSFGTKPAAQPPSSTFSFNLSKPTDISTAPSAPGTGSFSFNLPPAKPAPAGASAEAEDEDEENIGREDPTVIIKTDNPDDQCVFEVEKAKIFEFKKAEKRWADKGTHPLKVLVNTTTKNARILVRNEIGKIVLNSALYKGLAVQAQETKGKKSGVITTLQVDGTMTQFLLKVASAKVDELITALENSTPK